jgi:hypothetical protein
VRLLADRHLQPVRAVLSSLVPLAAQLPPDPATYLLRQAEQEMTRLGWNPNGSFSRVLTEAVARLVVADEVDLTGRYSGSPV